MRLVLRRLLDVLDVGWAEDIDLPVFRASEVSSSLLSTGSIANIASAQVYSAERPTGGTNKRR